MTDECVVYRQSGQSVDPVTGAVTVGRSSVYEGVCKVQTSGGVGSDSTDTGSVLDEWLERVDFPWGVTTIGADMVVEVTKSADVTLVGKRFRLVSPQSRKTYATACRWNAKEVA